MTPAFVVILVLGAGSLVVARCARWLTPGGVVAASVVGAAVLAGAGPGPCLLLLFFFVGSSVLTRYRFAAKPGDDREHGAGERPFVRRPQGRDATQVVANGGVPAVLALFGLAGASGWLPYAITGAIAAATADSWATEIGTAVRGPTRLITSFVPVPPGRSGGVSAAGTAAGVAGAIAIGALAAWTTPLWWTMGSPSPAIALTTATAGGVVGMVLDSVLGATLELRWRWVDNEVVNSASAFAGAVVAAAAASFLALIA